MIIWNDFMWDDFLGPILKIESGTLSVMEDAKTKTMALGNAMIQETRSEQRPARMVGLSSLDSCLTGTEANQSSHAQWQNAEED